MNLFAQQCGQLLGCRAQLCVHRPDRQPEAFRLETSFAEQGFRMHRNDAPTIHVVLFRETQSFLPDSRKVARAGRIKLARKGEDRIAAVPLLASSKSSKIDVTFTQAARQRASIVQRLQASFVLSHP